MIRPLTQCACGDPKAPLSKCRWFQRMMRHATSWVAVSLLLFAGCAEQPRVRRALAQPYQPANLHRRSAVLPAHLRRVALLPLTAEEGATDAQAAVRDLEPILLVELRKRAAFEVVPVSREQLKLWSGRSNWRQEDPLPPDFLTRVQDETGSQGLMFAYLSAYRPYPPLATGWRLSLIECATGNAWWSVDEVFDAGSVEVIKSAQAYARGQMNQPAIELDSTAVLSSPSRFAQYTAAAVVATLPGRGPASK